MRALAVEIGSELVTPPKANRRNPWVLTRLAYRARNDIECYFGRIKRLRGIAKCYAKLAQVCFNQVLLACVHFMTKRRKRALASPSRVAESSGIFCLKLAMSRRPMDYQSQTGTLVATSDETR